MDRSVVVAFGATLLLLPSAAPAAPPDACPPVGDASVLVRCALERSPAVVAARHDVGTARARETIAGYVFPSNPTVEVSGGVRRAPTAGNDIDRSVELAQAIEIGGQRGARRAVAGAEIEGAIGSLDALEREVAMTTLQGVLRVTSARAGVRFAAEEREIAERLVEVSAGRAREGVGAQLDAELAEAARVQARRAETSADAALRDAESELALTVGADVRLADDARLPEVAPPTESADALEARAAASRTSPLRALAVARVARARIAVLGRERAPTPTLGAYVRHEDFADALGLRVTVPIPLLRRNRGEIAEQEAVASQADAGAAAAALRARLEVRAAHAAWLRAAALLREVPTDLDQRLAADAKALRDAYARGTMAFPTVLAALRETFAARRSLVGARLDAQGAEFALAVASAAPLPSGLVGGAR